jgi:transposase-like protein
MAKAKKSTAKTTKNSNGDKETKPAEQASPAAAEQPKPAAKKAGKRSGRKSAATKVVTKKAAKPRRGRKAKVGATRPSRKLRVAKTGRRYTPAERARILSVAKADGLTGAAASKRFGISTLTFYTWRKKAGSSAKPGRKSGRTAGRRGSGQDFSEDIRTQVQARVRELLPGIIRSEVSAAIRDLILTGRGR